MARLRAGGFLAEAIGIITTRQYDIVLVTSHRRLLA